MKAIYSNNVDSYVNKRVSSRKHNKKINEEVIG